MPSPKMTQEKDPERESKIKKAILINPNLGHPRFLNVGSDLQRMEIPTPLLFISNVSDPGKFKELIVNKLNVVPVFEYRWKLEKELEEKRKEKRSIWTRIKNIFLRKKSPNQQILDYFDEERIELMGQHAVRGEPMPAKILNVKSVEPCKLDDFNYLKDNFCHPHEFLVKHGIFKEFEFFFIVRIGISLSDEVKDFLAFRNFMMCDIIHELDDEEKRVNYHSIVFTKKDWKDFTFIQATDLHLAERYDRVYGLIKQGIKPIPRKERDDEGLIIKDKSPRAILKRLLKPLEKRINNPNNQFRKFIKLMNEKVRANELDFIVFTGDLVDFVLLSRLPKESRSFDYDRCNWRIFKNLIINHPDLEEHEGVFESEELLCPIFTVLGNHDYRPHHYSLLWLKMCERFGLTHEEAEALEGKLSIAISPWNSIVKDSMTLAGYCTEINPSLNFSLKLSGNSFIFLDSGSDSYMNIVDFISGHPSLTGVSTEQIGFLENVRRREIQKDDNVFLFLHAPVINPVSKGRIFKSIKKSIFRRKVKTLKLEDFKEFRFGGKLEKKKSKVRINNIFNIKHSTVSSHWDELLEFCKTCNLILTGHTHTLREFRIHYDDIANQDEHSFSVYHDIYSQIFTRPKEIKKFGPFAVQTPALWLDGKGEPKGTVSFREIKIINGKIASFGVVTIY